MKRSLATISKLVKKAMSRINAHFIDGKKCISIIDFLDTLKFGCNTNRFYEEAEIRGLLWNVNRKLADALNSGICATNKSSLIVSPEQSIKSGSHELP